MRCAQDESVRYLRNGLGAVATLDYNEERADHELALGMELVEGMRILDQYDDALNLLDQLEETAGRFQRQADLSRVHFYRGSIFFPLGNLDGCLHEQEKARQYAREAGSPENEARALSGLGDAHYMRGQMITAHRHFEDCVSLCRDHGLAAIEAANLALCGHTNLYVNELASALSDCMRAVDMAVENRNSRAEIVARGSVAGKIYFDMGNLAEARAQCTRAMELAERLGAGRFEPINLAIIAKVAFLEGERADAIDLAEKGVAISRDTGLKSSGGMAFGALAVVTDDAGRRGEILAEGMTVLESGSVSHNHLWFYRDAMGSCLAAGDWPAVEQFSKVAEGYTAAEPLPWMDMLIARARLLAALGQNPSDTVARSDLKQLRVDANRVGFMSILPAMDAAMA